ncbi:hypothetical protein [Halosimplex carlsbadense]|nr:hypothetical protein [Halosimplex carlsbadense]
MGRAGTRFRRRLRASTPWLVMAAVFYAVLFGAGLAAMAAYYDADLVAVVTGSVGGWLFLASVGGLAAFGAERFREYFRPNFEPGRPRDEYLASTARWFDDED